MLSTANSLYVNSLMCYDFLYSSSLPVGTHGGEVKILRLLMDVCSTECISWVHEWARVACFSCLHNIVFKNSTFSLYTLEKYMESTRCRIYLFLGCSKPRARVYTTVAPIFTDLVSGQPYCHWLQ